MDDNGSTTVKDNVSISSQLFRPKILKTESLIRGAKIFVKYREDGKVVFTHKNRVNGKTETRIMEKGDELHFNYELTIEATEKVYNNHFFPITINFCDQEYKLNKTKNDKLILTK